MKGEVLITTFEVTVATSSDYADFTLEGDELKERRSSAVHHIHGKAHVINIAD